MSLTFGITACIPHYDVPISTTRHKYIYNKTNINVVALLLLHKPVSCLIKSTDLTLEICPLNFVIAMLLVTSHNIKLESPDAVT